MIPWFETFTQPAIYSKAITYRNPFLADVPILYPLKTPENLWFSGVFEGYKMGTLPKNTLNHVWFHNSQFSIAE